MASVPPKQPPDFPGVPDPRPKGMFGHYTNTQPWQDVITWYNQDGSLYSHEVRNSVDTHTSSYRFGKTSNRRLPLEGTSSLWIPPSTYSRTVTQLQLIRPGKYFRQRISGVKEGDYQLNTAYFGLWKDVHPAWKDWYDSGEGMNLLVNENTRGRLITECLLNLKDQKVNMGENLATAKQTFGLFARHGSTLFRSLIAARRGNWKDAFRHLGLSKKSYPVGLGLSQRYLEYIYGVKPLMEDIYGAYELLNEQLKPALLVYARRVLREEAQRTVQADDLSKDFKLSWTEHAKRRDKIQLVARVNSSVARDVSRAGLSNPSSLAWDLLPWSFVVDWAMPIGSVLAAADATRGLDFVGGYISRNGYRTSVQTALNRWSPRWSPTEELMQVAFTRSNHREALGGFPRPVLYAKSPFSSSHLVTALALFRQLV